MQKYSLFFSSCALFFLLFLNIKATIAQPKTHKVHLLQSNTLESGGSYGRQVQRLIGNVILEQDSVFVYCDSAHLNNTLNNFTAYSKVHVQQGENFNLYGDTLYYIGDEKIGKFRGNIIVQDSTMTLRTQFLDFDLKDNTGKFYNGGVLNDSSVTLTSQRGYYFPNGKIYVFSENVEVHGDSLTMYSDSAKYNMLVEKSFFFGPTQIINEKNYIYCENGWYDVANEIAQFNQNAYYLREERKIKGDSLYYNRAKGYGEAFKNVELIDTTENASISGHYAYFDEITEYSMVTDSALFVKATEKDTIFVHADTLMSQYDSTKTHKQIRAFYKVKIFKSDFQAKCDSIFYSLSDSIAQLHGNPVLWSDENQISADYIEVHTQNNKPKIAYLKNQAFIISKVDSLRFNQIKGRDMTGFFTNKGQIYRIDVDGNGESIYYPAEEDGTLIGVNKSLCEKMKIFMQDRQVKEILFLNSPEGTLYPVKDLPPLDAVLDGFKWEQKQRPQSKLDVFLWKQ